MTSIFHLLIGSPTCSPNLLRWHVFSCICWCVWDKLLSYYMQNRRMTEDNSTGFTLVVAVSLHVRIWEVFWCVFPPNCHTPLNDEQCVMWLHSLQHWTCDHLTFLQSLIFFVFWPYYHSLSNYNHSGTFCFVFWPCHMTSLSHFCEECNHFQFCHSIKQCWTDSDTMDQRWRQFAEQLLAICRANIQRPKSVRHYQKSMVLKDPEALTTTLEEKAEWKICECVCVCVCMCGSLCLCVVCMVLHTRSLLCTQTQ